MCVCEQSYSIEPFVSETEQIALHSTRQFVVRDKLSSATKDSLTDTVDWFAFALPLLIIAHPSTNNNQKIAKVSVGTKGSRIQSLSSWSITLPIYNEANHSSIDDASANGQYRLYATTAPTESSPITVFDLLVERPARHRDAILCATRVGFTAPRR
jgi:hypothetical protein